MAFVLTADPSKPNRISFQINPKSSMIFLLDDQYPSLLPDPEKADENGMVAVSETLGIERLVAAYQKRDFSMDEDGTGTKLLVLVFSRTTHGSPSI